MDPAERLAAYLDAALPADERAAVEAELARDPELARTLAALQRADTALAALPPATPVEGFDARLRSALDEVLAETLGVDRQVEELPTSAGAPAAARAEEATVTPLSAATGTRGRRAARRETSGGFWSRQPRWVPATVGAAAGLLVLVGGGIVVTQLTLGSGDDMAATEADAGADAAIMGLDGDGAAAGPVVILAGRDLDEAMVDALLDGPELGTIAAESLAPDAGLARATDYQSMLGVDASVTTAESAPADGALDDGDDAADDGGADAPVEEGEAAEDSVAADGTEARATDDEAITRCLEELLTGGTAAVPAYVELGTYEGVEVVLIGLVTPDPTTGAYTRTEAWVLDRANCQVLRFSQR